MKEEIEEEEEVGTTTINSTTGDINIRSKILEILKLAGKYDENIQKQCCYILATSRIILDEYEDDDELYEIMGNVNLSEHFLKLVHELDVQQAKSPEDIYKTHLSEGRARIPENKSQPTYDNAKENLAKTFVNSFINCAFGSDSLITIPNSEWVFRNRNLGMLSAAASHGLINLWDVELGFNNLDIYSRAKSHDNIIAGGLLGSGIISSNVTSEMDAAYTLLTEILEVKIGAILGLAIAYCGSSRDDVLEILIPYIIDDSSSLLIASYTCLAIGYIYVGTANYDISHSIIQAILDRNDIELNHTTSNYMLLSLGLIWLGQYNNEQYQTILNDIDENLIQKKLRMKKLKKKKMIKPLLQTMLMQ